MSVRAEITVTGMLSVSIHLGATCVHVTLDTMVMVEFALVSEYR